MYKTLYFVGCAVLTCGAAYAGYVYESLDIDRSGNISQEEAAAMPGLVESWKQLDVNVDGALDQEEFARFDFVQSEAPAAGDDSGGESNLNVWAQRMLGKKTARRRRNWRSAFSHATIARSASEEHKNDAFSGVPCWRCGLVLPRFC